MITNRNPKVAVFDAGSSYCCCCCCYRCCWRCFCFRGQTFTSMTGFRSHVKSRQRAGSMTQEDASLATPVEVKVLDRYLTVASVSSHQHQEATPTTTTTHRHTHTHTPPSGTPTRLCSLRVILLLEDMGPTGDPEDQEVSCLHSASARMDRLTACGVGGRRAGRSKICFLAAHSYARGRLTFPFSEIQILV